MDFQYTGEGCTFLKLNDISIGQMMHSVAAPNMNPYVDFKHTGFGNIYDITFKKPQQNTEMIEPHVAMDPFVVFLDSGKKDLFNLMIGQNTWAQITKMMQQIYPMWPMQSLLQIQMQMQQTMLLVALPTTKCVVFKYTGIENMYAMTSGMYTQEQVYQLMQIGPVPRMRLNPFVIFKYNGLNYNFVLEDEMGISPQVCQPATGMPTYVIFQKMAFWNMYAMTISISNFWQPPGPMDAFVVFRLNGNGYAITVGKDIRPTLGMGQTQALNSDVLCRYIGPGNNYALTIENYDQEQINQRMQVNAATENMAPSWKQLLGKELTDPNFVKLQSFLKAERSLHNKIKIYPPVDEVFSWTHHCSPEEVKVVILGQDPYPTPGQAHGLAFSTKEEIKDGKHPRSLEKFFDELERDIHGFKRPLHHGKLTSWAKQGVLLLNVVLTVRVPEPYTHEGKEWEKITNAVLSYLDKKCTGLVFMLWGGKAKRKRGLIKNQSHHVLVARHPSPQSERNKKSVTPHFSGCNHFSKANELLKNALKGEIIWKLPEFI